MTNTVYAKTFTRTAYALALACFMLVAGIAVTHADGYNSGRGGYSFANNYGYGYNSGNGYSGSYGYTNAPHRGDWMNKLNEQRRYEEYMQKQGANHAACGFTGAPSYCYTLVTKPRYPAEYRVVRY